MNISFEEYEDIIKEEIDKKVQKLDKINLKDKNDILSLSKDVTYVISSLVVPALSPFSLTVNYKIRGNSMIFEFAAEKMYVDCKGKIGDLKLNFTPVKNKESYKYKNSDFSLNSHYFLLHGNIDKIR